MGGRGLPVLDLNEAERFELEALARRRNTAQALAQRAQLEHVPYAKLLLSGTVLASFAAGFGAYWGLSLL